MDKMLGKGPQRFFITVRNADSAALTQGQAMQWNANGTRDGIDVIKMSTALAAALFAGLVPLGKTIGVGYYGMAQTYGLHESAVVYGHGTSTGANVVIGDIWGISSGGALTVIAAGAAASSVNPAIVAMETVGSLSASSLTTVAKVFLRCM
jgi:hypothetical protein